MNLNKLCRSSAVAWSNAVVVAIIALIVTTAACSDGVAGPVVDDDDPAHLTIAADVSALAPGTHIRVTDQGGTPSLISFSFADSPDCSKSADATDEERDRHYQCIDDLLDSGGCKQGVRLHPTLTGRLDAFCLE